MSQDVVILAQDAIDPAATLNDFIAHCTDSDGAIVHFIGLARGTNHQGHPVSALVLEHYRGVTLASMQNIAAAARERFTLSQLMIVHRTGAIMPQEPIVLVAAASAHRRAAFEAADYMMDRLKTEAVFWKYELHPGSTIKHWIEPTSRDTDDSQRWQKD